MKPALILQARLDSSRLPGKALLPLGGKPLLLVVMERLRQIKAAPYILACSEDSAGVFAPLAARAGFLLFPGAKEDVLERYRACAAHFGLSAAGRIIRATGDNPFVYTDAACAIDAEGRKRRADYAAYSGLPYGAGVESVSVAALFRAARDASTAYEREHVCPYLYNHPEQFRLHRPLAPLKWQHPELRLTIDTPADYEAACAWASLRLPPPLSGNMRAGVTG